MNPAPPVTRQLGLTATPLTRFSSMERTMRPVASRNDPADALVWLTPGRVPRHGLQDQRADSVLFGRMEAAKGRPGCPLCHQQE